MTILEAEALIEKGFNRKNQSIWADLGCGSGVFTYALTGFLEKGSKIHAIDKTNQDLKSQMHNVDISFSKSDVEKDPFPFNKLDGILMANSLHYIKDQKDFILKIKSTLIPGGKIILVEYDTERSNQWVPYPISYDRVTSIFRECGFKNINRIGERQSVYRSEKIYSCLIS